MNIEKLNKERKSLNEELPKNDVFFNIFGQLDDDAYSDASKY